MSWCDLWGGYHAIGLVIISFIHACLHCLCIILYSSVYAYACYSANMHASYTVTEVWRWPSKFTFNNIVNVISEFSWLLLYWLQVIHSMSELFPKFCSLVISALNSDLNLELLISACQQKSSSLVLEAAFDLLDHFPLPNTIEQVYVSQQCLLGLLVDALCSRMSVDIKRKMPWYNLCDKCMSIISAYCKEYETI